jgi:hypothetical protein
MKARQTQHHENFLRPHLIRLCSKQLVLSRAVIKNNEMTKLTMRCEQIYSKNAIKYRFWNFL